MNVLCAICQDLLEPSNDIHITPCGHVFHFPCLNLWLDKSKTCPQCRQRVSRDKITRIYFNFSNSEVIKEDSVSLQQKVDSLMFQVKLKETECKNYITDNADLKKQTRTLREELKDRESKITQINSAIHALKEQTSYFKDKCKDYEHLQVEKKKLENQLETYHNIKNIICATSDEVDKILSNTTDATTLSLYVSMLKRELSAFRDKRRETKSHMKRLQQEIQTLKKERESFAEDFVKRIEELEDTLEICKSERDVLKKRLSKFESGTKQFDKSEVPVKSDVVPEESNTTRKREMDISFEILDTSVKKQKQGNDEVTDLIVIPSRSNNATGNEENSPYLPTKSKGILGLKERISQRGGRTISSKKILSKKSDSTLPNSRRDSSITFDGFGGHSKLEVFPKTSPSKKRPINDSSKNKKLKIDLTSTNKQLDDFIINLT